MKLTWLGHFAFRIEAGAAKILIDPFCPTTCQGTTDGRGSVYTRQNAPSPSCALRRELPPWKVRGRTPLL